MIDNQTNLIKQTFSKKDELKNIWRSKNTVNLLQANCNTELQAIKEGISSSFCKCCLVCFYVLWIATK